MFRGAIILLGLLASDLAAQPSNLPPKFSQPPNYVKFAIEGNPEQMLADFLKSPAGLDFIQKFIANKLLDPSPNQIENLRKQFGGEPQLLEKLERLEKLLRDHPGLQKANRGEREALFKKLLESNNDFAKNLEGMMKSFKQFNQKEGLDGAPKIDGFMPPELQGESSDVKLPNLDDFLDEDFSFDDRLSEWLTNLLKNENFQREMTEFFKDAPGLRDAIGDLELSLKGLDANGNWLPKIPDFGGGKWSFDLKPPKIPFELGQLPKLPNLKMPQLPRINLPMPRLGNIGLPHMPGFGGVPNVNMPSAPNVSGGREWAYIVMVIVAGGFAWWFLRRVKWSPNSPKAQVAALLRSLPTSITTRTQLQKAFDTLAIMRLGDKARPWNHRLIARQLGDEAPMADAAQAFASLYEIARYTPGDDRLSRAEQDKVRDSLAVLTAGVA